MADEETTVTNPPAEERKPRTKPKETSGEYLWRVFKPAGCIFFLLLFIVFMIFCFTWKGTPPEAAPTAAPTASAAMYN